MSVDTLIPNQVWTKTIPNLAPLKGVGLVRAENCGKCHSQIYEEWKTSTHANALSDLQFQSELAKESSPAWLCLNCHIPVGNQREFLVEGLRQGNIHLPKEIANPQFDPVMKAEAVTCATCHVRSDENGESYVLGANGKTDAMHPVKVNKEALRKRCYDCHNQTYTLEASLVCYFQTGKELQEAKKYFPEKDCVSCHMPTKYRSFVKKELGKSAKESHIHGFVGGGIPKQFSLYSHQLKNGYQPGFRLLGWQRDGNKIQITYKNESAGHYIPSGDPERFFKLEMVFFDSSNVEIQKVEKRIGQIWEWSPVAKLKSDNRLKPKETRSWQEEIPKEAKKIIFRLTHVRLSDQTRKYMEATFENVPDPYKIKVKNMKEYYPQSSNIVESEWDLESQKRKDKSLESIFLENEKRRGE
ncbi:cytochrome c554 and C-prime [Leptospira ryugenii]|uniref:Cytochrome c554 and C-prime n=1 Tax=Leptospira ryugenii TaxID=1917863 RepID=A0A2P2E1K6_9LEPT|nr:cytochrome c554 and C-prime [Leptospira ryugenii]